MGKIRTGGLTKVGGRRSKLTEFQKQLRDSLKLNVKGDKIFINGLSQGAMWITDGGGDYRLGMNLDYHRNHYNWDTKDYLESNFVDMLTAIDDKYPNASKLSFNDLKKLVENVNSGKSDFSSRGAGSTSTSGS